MTETIEKILQKALTSEPWDIAIDVFNTIDIKYYDAVNEILWKYLKSHDSRIRNKAALFLAETKCDASIDKLIDAILNPIDPNNRGTIVYSLGFHNCEDIIIDLFKIVFFGNFESKLEAISIIEEGNFYFDEPDILEINSIWKSLQSCNPIDKNISEFSGRIQEQIDTFFEALK